VAGPAVLQERFDAYLVEQRDRIELLSDEGFEAIKQSVIHRLDKRDISLSQRTDRLERGLRLGYTDFDHGKRLARAIQPLTQGGLVELYDEVFFGEERGRILVRSTGSEHMDEAPLNPCFGDDCVLPKLVERVQ
jgi:protease-3